MPIISEMDSPVQGMPDFKVTGGYSAETSGGILAMLEPAKAHDFIAELREVYGQESWIVGEVTDGTR